jgi:endoglucanase
MMLGVSACVPGQTHVVYERGVNVYTLEMNRHSDLPVSDWGEPQASYDYLASRGVRIVRLAFSWGMLQPPVENKKGKIEFKSSLSAPVDVDAMAVLREQVHRIENADMRPVIDLHNGCSYPEGPGAKPAESVFCGDGLSVDQQVGIWLTLSDEFRNDDEIYAYDLFNEPRTSNMTFTTYKKYSQAVVDALRENGDPHAFWLNAMVGDWTFADNVKDGPWVTSRDGTVDLSIVYSQHFYPGSTAQGNRAYNPSQTYKTFLGAISRFGRWCEKWEVHCSIGELGWPGSTSQAKYKGSYGGEWDALGELAYLRADEYELDVTYFAAMGTDSGYLFAYDSSKPTLPARRGIDSARSQAAVIEKHLSYLTGVTRPSPTRTQQLVDPAR